MYDLMILMKWESGHTLSCATVVRAALTRSPTGDEAEAHFWYLGDSKLMQPEKKIFESRRLHKGTQIANSSTHTSEILVHKKPTQT
jgi:hypothetical protein